MNDFTVQREALVQLQEGDPRPVSRVLASDQPLTAMFRLRLATMLAPDLYEVGEDSEPLPCRLVILKKVGRPKRSRANAIWTMVHSAHHLDNLTLQQAIGQVADKFQISDGAVRNIYNRIEKQFRSEMRLKLEEEFGDESSEFSDDVD